VASWPVEVRYFWVLLWGYLDDKGRGLDVPKTIAGDCFPHDEKYTAAVVNRWIALIANTKTDEKVAPLCRYEVAGRRYLHSTNWGEHQRPARPTPSRLPPCPLHEPPTGDDDSPSESPTGSQAEAIEPPDGAMAYPQGAVDKAPSRRKQGDETQDRTEKRSQGRSRTGNETSRKPDSGSDLDVAPPGSRASPQVNDQDPSEPPTAGIRNLTEGEVDRGDARRESPPGGPSGEPPSRCPEHIDEPKPPPCGACADARRAHDRWEAQRAARIAAAPKCRRHRGQPADNCALCRSEALATEDE
jgi:hypothetical protein